MTKALTGVYRMRYRLSVAFGCALLLSACIGPQSRLSQQEIAATSADPHRETTIALLGGTGMTGGHILKEALAQGYRVRVLSRSPEKLGYLGNRVDVVTGDARQYETIEKLLRSSDVVISAIGPPQNSGKGPQNLTTTVSGHVLSAMAEENISRYIAISGAGVVAPEDQRNFSGWLMRQLVRLRYPALLKDRQSEYDLLAASDAYWTLVRSPLIESMPFEKDATASLRTPGSFRLRAGELARFVIEQITSEQFLRQAPFLYSP